MPAVIFIGPTEQLLEMPDSPVYDLGKDPTCRRTYMGLYPLALASAPPRGTVGTGDMAGWLVLDSKISRARRGLGKLEINYGASGSGSGQTLPPDDFGAHDSLKLNPALERNGRYSTLTDADFAKVDACIRCFSKDGTKPFALTGMLADLFNKKKRGTRPIFHLAGFKYSWTRSYYSLTGVANVGGFLETPLGRVGQLHPWIIFLPAHRR